MRRYCLLALLVLSLCTFGLAQDHSSTIQPNTLYVGADGKYEADPDTALIQFNIAAQEQTSKDAYDHASRAAEQVRQLLKSDGIDPKSAQLSSFEFQPVYDYRDPKRKLVGYRVSSNVSVKIKDFNKIAPIIQGLADIDITGDQSLSYMLDNIDIAKQKAVQDAYQRAHSLAEILAQTAGKPLGDLLYSSIDTFEQPRPRPMMMSAMKSMAAAPTPAPTEEFGEQKITVTAHVNALFVLK